MTGPELQGLIGCGAGLGGSPQKGVEAAPSSFMGIIIAFTPRICYRNYMN